MKRDHLDRDIQIDRCAQSWNPISQDLPANPAFTMSMQHTDGIGGKPQQIPSEFLNLPSRSVRPLKLRPALSCPNGGADRDRTDDLKLAKLALSQLSYGPEGAARRCRLAQPGGPGTS
jgi:hypothetical protein